MLQLRLLLQRNDIQWVPFQATVTVTCPGCTVHVANLADSALRYYLVYPSFEACIEAFLQLLRLPGRASALGTEGVCVTELGLLEAAREALPFQLTGGQDLALNNILRDMQGPLPMMCLLQVPPQRQRGPKPGFMPIHLPDDCLAVGTFCCCFPPWLRAIFGKACTTLVSLESGTFLVCS